MILLKQYPQLHLFLPNSLIYLDKLALKSIIIKLLYNETPTFAVLSQNSGDGDCYKVGNYYQISKILKDETNISTT